MTWVAVAIGGAIGSMLRHGVNLGAERLIIAPSPLATFTVNMIGSFAIGLLAGLLASGRLEMTSTVRTLVFVGILGGFTTFSSYMLDTLTLAEGRNGLWAVFNVVSQVSFGYALAFAGYRLGL